VQHLADRSFDADEQRAGNDRIADVEFFETSDKRDVARIGEIQAVARVDAQAELARSRGGAAQTLELAGACSIARAGIGTGVQLHEGRAQLRRRFELARLGVDEQADQRAARREQRQDLRDALALENHVQAAFGGELLATLGHEADHSRAALEREADHFLIEAALQIQDRATALAQLAHVAVLDVAAILAQVHRDPVGSRALRGQGPGDGIGLDPAASLPQRGHVVDVDVQAQHGGIVPTRYHRDMRIIAGEYGGRLIKAPPGEGTRPMLDRVREALFSTLGERIDGALVLDLFAGTGSLGLESLSRGAAFARMVELDPRVVKLLQSNVAGLGAGERVRVVTADALSPAAWRDPGDKRFDVIFYDPPYPLLRAGPGRKRVVDALLQLASERLQPEGTIVFHAPRNLVLSSEFGSLAARERVYGTNSLWYLTLGRPSKELS